MLLNDGLLNDGLLNDTQPGAPGGYGSALLNTFTLGGMSLNALGVDTIGTAPAPVPQNPGLVRGEHRAYYALLARVASAHAAALDIGVFARGEHIAPIPMRLLVEHAVVIGYRIAPVQHVASYGVHTRVSAQHLSLADVMASAAVKASHTAPWGHRVAAQHTAGVTYRARVSAQHMGTWAAFSRALAEHDALAGFSFPVGAQHQAGLDMFAFSPVSAQHRASLDIATATVLNLSGEPHVEAAGLRLPILGADLAFDEGGYAWTCTVELANVADYQALRRNDPFALVLFGDRFEFIVDSKGIDRSSPAGVSITVSGISPVAMLDVQPDRAAEITRTWTVAAQASDIVRELAGDIPVDWRIVDWTIPAYRLGVAAASPISVIQQIARAAGGVAESTPAGGLLIRPSFPVTVPDWETAAPDHILTDKADTLSVRDGVAGVSRFDKLYLSDAQAGGAADRIEWVADEGNAQTGRLLVYPAAWRENLVVTSTRSSAVLVPLGIVSREEEETIEIAGGTGATAFPVDAVLDYQWLDTDLGGVSVPPYSNQVSAGAGLAKPYSLLRIRYRTKAIVYQASYPEEGMVQFIVEEV